MGSCQRAPPTGPIEQAPGEDGLVELLLHQRLVSLDVVLLLLGCEAELHVDLLFGSGRAPFAGRAAKRCPIRGGRKSLAGWLSRESGVSSSWRQGLAAAPFRPVGQTANSASVFRPKRRCWSPPVLTFV